MIKKLLSLALAVLLFCSGCAGGGQEIIGSDTTVVSRFENAAELQKNIFIGQILSVSTENALITKYNIDITTYTVYEVNITRSINGFTPLGQAKLYCVGTPDEFISRINMKKGEQYIIDAQPWIYGDEIVYLLSVFTDAYPRIDTAGMVTLAKSDTQALSCGSLSEYLSQYDAAAASLTEREPDFYSPEKTLSRFGVYVEEIYTKNTDRKAYSPDKGYKWLPEDEFIEKTAEKSKALYAEYKELSERGGVTKKDVEDFIFSVLSGNF